MGESIWTRERTLKEEEAGLIHNLRQDYKSIGIELKMDDWSSAVVSAELIRDNCVKMQLVERELENVTALCDGWERIEKRMDKLEKMVGGEQ